MRIIDSILKGKGDPTHKIIPIEDEEPKMPKPVDPRFEFLEKVTAEFSKYVIEEAKRIAKEDGREKFTINDIKKVLEDPIKIGVN